ncbi:hypothetical protein H4R99_005075, partial [Coemansia sp. RSA 1722]
CRFGYCVSQRRVVCRFQRSCASNGAGKPATNDFRGTVAQRRRLVPVLRNHRGNQLAARTLGQAHAVQQARMRLQGLRICVQDAAPQPQKLCRRDARRTHPSGPADVLPDVSAGLFRVRKRLDPLRRMPSRLPPKLPSGGNRRQRCQIRCQMVLRALLQGQCQETPDRCRAAEMPSAIHVLSPPQRSSSGGGGSPEWSWSGVGYCCHQKHQIAQKKAEQRFVRLCSSSRACSTATEAECICFVDAVIEKHRCQRPCPQIITGHASFIKASGFGLYCL